MNEYLRRWATAFVLLATVAIGLQFEFSSYGLANVVLIIGLLEYWDMHKKILNNFYPKLAKVNSEFVKYSSIPQWLILFGFTYLTRWDTFLLVLALIIILLITWMIRIVQASSIIGKLDENKEGFTILSCSLSSIMLEIIAIWLFGFWMSLYWILYLSNGKLVFVGLWLVFQTDHGALVIGSKFGKNSINQFFHHKTYEGVFGGFLFSFISALGMKLEAAFLIKVFYPNSLTLTDYAIIGLCVPLFSILGDLFESFLKRWAKVSNSGSLLPGHGGMFDRIDSVLMSAPFLYYYNVLVLQS